MKKPSIKKTIEWVCAECGYRDEYQKRFIDCRNPETGMPLAYDLWLPSINLLVEYDGEQHFKPYVKVRKHVMTLDQYQRLKRRDAVKTKYAEDNGIRLIRVPYTVSDVEKYIEQEIKYG